MFPGHLHHLRLGVNRAKPGKQRLVGESARRPRPQLRERNPALEIFDTVGTSSTYSVT